MSSAKYVAEEQVQANSFQRHVAPYEYGNVLIITGPLAVARFTAELDPSISDEAIKAAHTPHEQRSHRQ